MTGPACPSPPKARYATESTADRAGRWAVFTVGRHLTPYECRCGWWHLTKITPAAQNRTSR